MIKTLLKSCLFFIIVLFGNYSYTYSQTNNVLASSKKGWIARPFERKVFIENKKQFSQLLPSEKVNYSYCIDNGSTVFFYPNEVLFYFSKPMFDRDELEEKTDLKEEREREMKLQKKNRQFVSLKWLNANPNATIEVSEEQTTDYGYIIRPEDQQPYTVHCKGYRKLRIKNLYNGIDAEYFFTEKDGFKYNLYVSEGADISMVQQAYTGAKKIVLTEEGNIQIKTLLGNIIDHSPKAYLTSDNSKSIKADFLLKKNIVTFNIENLQNQAYTIDPWVSTPTMSGAPVDNGADQYGNTYVTSPQYILEKYSSTGALVFSTNVFSGGSTPTIFGDMLTDSRGYCFFNTVIGSQPSGDATAVDSAGNFLWNSFGINECWRFVLNECTRQVLSLTGYRHSSTGFVKINTETGALNGYTQSGNCCQDPHCGAIDYNGDVYCVVSENGAGTKIYKWTPSNTIATTYTALGSWGYGTGYVGDGSFAQGYNGMTILGNFLYIYDGATLFKVNKTNGTSVNQITVPGGVNKHNGGIYITSCGQLFVGSATGVYMYDPNFNQLDFKSTPNKVFDLTFNPSTQKIDACGPGFVAELDFTIPPCAFQTQPFIQPSCGGLPNGYIKLNLTGGVPDYTYTWSSNGTVLSQTTDSIGGLGPGSYKCVFSDNKCPIPNIDSTIIVVNPVTTHANFGFSNQCFPSALPFSDSSQTNFGSINDWQWTFGDGNDSTQQNLSHKYSASGNYTVKLVVTTTNGCKDSTTKIVNVYPKPEADFTFVNKCDGTAIPFISSSIVQQPDAISSWQWDFGDNITSSGNPANHLYSAPGIYTTALITVSNHSCSDTISKKDTVYNNPTAAFNYSDVCLSDSLLFSNTSSVNTPATISDYLWDYRNGSTSTLNNPHYKYLTAGAYNVTLITTTANGCTNAANHTVNTFDPPTSNFTFSNICLIDSAHFHNASLNPSMGTIASWQWDFGDGSMPNTSTNSPAHLYSNVGRYQVSLITHSSNLGCADTVKDSITVFSMPIASFTVPDVCLNDPCIFSDQSTVASGSVNSWHWNFGDGSTVNTNQNPSYTYSNHGTYSSTLIVTTNNGCNDTLSQNIIVHPLPVAQYNSAAECLGSVTPFNDLSAIATPDNIQSWQWNFGDNTSFSTTQNTTHTYSSIGTYTAELLIVSQFGCKDSISHSIVINPNPVVNFVGIDSAGCEPLCVNFQNLSNIATGNNIGYTWNSGVNGQTSTIENPTFCYSNDSIYNPVNYTVTLTVTSDSGCITTLTKNNYIIVYPLPEANFIIQPNVASIVEPIISITDLSIGANTWAWAFGDSTFDTISSPLPHTFKDTGSYTIMLITTTQYGCTDTSYKTAIIEPTFLIYIPNAFSPNSDGVNDTFIPQGIYIQEFEMMIFDRWGNRVFFSDDITKAWDGRANYGTDIAQQDVYVYSIKVTDFLNKKHTYRGTVTLIK